MGFIALLGLILYGLYLLAYVIDKDTIFEYDPKYNYSGVGYWLCVGASICMLALAFIVLF